MRVLMISNQTSPEGHAGFRETYERMERTGELTSFRYVTPSLTAATQGHEAALAQLARESREVRPDVILITTPVAFGHDPAWVKGFLRSCGNPAVLYWEGDPWHRWAKPINRSMKAWLAASDIVFTTARRPQDSLLRKCGAGDVRFGPNTYCHVVFEAAERAEALDLSRLTYDAVFIGNNLAHWGRVSRVPGAVQRAQLVRKLQRERDLNLAVYGDGWQGRGAKGILRFPQQVHAIREGLMSVNWDHFWRHESYSSNRLPISMIAGRIHVTTAHRCFDWVPGERDGLFLESNISAILKRVRELMAAPVDDLLALGAAAHRWACGRMSDREAARFMLAAADKRLLAGLPAEPWLRLASEWPR